MNKTFQIQIDAIRSVDDDIEKVESTISLQKKALLKNSKDVYESYRLFTELDAAPSLLNRNWIIKSFGIREEEFILRVHFNRPKVFCFGQRRIPSCFDIIIFTSQSTADPSIAPVFSEETFYVNIV